MKKVVFVLVVLLLFVGVWPVSAQGGPGTQNFYIRDFGACVNLPYFAVETEPDEFNTVYDVPGLFTINFAEYLLPLFGLPASNDAIYAAMIDLLNTVGASDYTRVPFNHPEYISAAVEFTLDGQRSFGMIFRNQDDRLFFLFADKAEGFDMLAIGRAIFAADRWCNPLHLAPAAPLPVLYEEYFEDGTADGWAWQNWIIVTEASGNHAWQGQGGQADFLPADWTDYLLQLRFRFLEAEDMVVGIRFGPYAGYAVSLFDEPYAANLARSYPQDWQGLAYDKVDISPTGWNTLRFEARGNVIRVIINDKLFAEVADDAFTSGGLELWAGDMTTVLVDDIQVWSLAG